MMCMMVALGAWAVCSQEVVSREADACGWQYRQSCAAAVAFDTYSTTFYDSWNFLSHLALARPITEMCCALYYACQALQTCWTMITVPSTAPSTLHGA
jgi:hypothetical protein